MLKRNTARKYTAYFKDRLVEKFTNYSDVTLLVNAIYQFEVGRLRNSFDYIAYLISAQFNPLKPLKGHKKRLHFIRALGYTIKLHEDFIQKT